MLVQPVDAFAHRGRETKCPGDIGAAGAAGDDQLLRDGVAVAKDVADRGAS
jgi:hypothetical protein